MATYEWKQTIFTPEAIDGVGHYIVRESVNKTNSPHFYDTGYLSTVMMKIGYIGGGRDINREIRGNYYCLIDMSDGRISTGFFKTKDADGNKIEDSSNWTWISFSDDENYVAKQKLCDYLNNNQHGETYRFATNEELIRVAAHQKWRTK